MATNNAPKLEFTRNWENAGDYPTVLMDEAQIRKDMQSLHDEAKDYLNNQLGPYIDAHAARHAPDGPDPITPAMLGAHSIADRGTLIPDGADLNDYTTVGEYYCLAASNAATLVNTPLTGAGFRLIVEMGYAAAIKNQIIIGTVNPVIWVRTLNTSNSTCSEWRKLLDSTGGIMTGNLTIERAGAATFKGSNTKTGREMYVETTSDNYTAIANRAIGDANNRAMLWLAPETADLDQALRLYRVVDGIGTAYNVIHTGNKNLVSANDVGLGNVPNVATDDQTPTYTAASTLAALKSGEKLSVAFGKIAKAISDLISHLANKANPHKVTAAQAGAVPTTRKINGQELSSDITLTLADVSGDGGAAPAIHASRHASSGADPITPSMIGLGNVPNVSTNNQTPTYTTASSLTALVSGEKLSVAFGKIAKAVSDLISHLANKSNPHGVTAAQAGAVPTARKVNGKALSTDVTLGASDVGAAAIKGDTFTGTVGVSNAMPIMKLTDTSANTGGKLYLADNNLVLQNENVTDDSTNRRMFRLDNSAVAPDIKNALRLVDITGGAAPVTYNVYGTHNKPTPADIGALARDGSNSMTGILALNPLGGNARGNVYKNETSEGDFGTQIVDFDANNSYMMIRVRAGTSAPIISLNGAESTFLHTGNVTAGTTDITAGTSALATGAQYLVYE